MTVNLVLYFSLCFCLLFFLVLITVTIYLSTVRVCKGSGQVFVNALSVELENMQFAKYYCKNIFTVWFERNNAKYDFFKLKILESANQNIEYVWE